MPTSARHELFYTLIGSGADAMIAAVDDSEILIGGQPHTILAAILVADAGKGEDALQGLKQEFGLSVQDEVKWNGMSLQKRDREAISQELLVLLQQATTFVTISEGTDRQQAAKDLATQLADYFDKQAWKNPIRLEIVFDEGIIADPTQYSQFLKASGRPVLGSIAFRSVRSHESGLIQLADILAGFNRLATEIALGRPNKEIEVHDDRLANPVSLDLLNYICLSLRWTTWGEVPLPPDPENPTFDGAWPFKYVGGFGLRLRSSIAPDLADAIYSSRIVYMGCLH
jgi:hypothetical protein